MHCYVLHSASLNRYYVGACQSDLESRILKHNDHSYGEHRFTAKATDWVLFLAIPCSSYAEARRIELQIKRMKSKTYIENLKKYPEIIEKLKVRASDSPDSHRGWGSLVRAQVGAQKKRIALFFCEWLGEKFIPMQRSGYREAQVGA